MLPIDDNEAFKIRANAGDGPDCDVNPVDPIPLITPLPPEIPCDDPPEPETETFFEPTPAPTPVRQLRLPGSIKLHSPELPITCPPGETTEEEPASTVLEFGALTRTINFSDITGKDGEPLFNQTTLYNLTSVAGTIRDVVWSYLGADAPSQDPERSEHISTNFGAKVAEVVAITKLPSAIISQFWNYLLAQQFALDDAAQALADRQLDCGFFNEDLWVVCYDRDAGQYRVTYASPSDPNAVFVPAGTTFSNIDQETANRLAIQSAVGVASCQFENQEQEVSCAELFGGDFLDSVLFSWPTLQDPQTTKISDIGGHVILDENGDVSPSSIEGYKALIYADVAARGTAAARRELVLKVSVPAGLTTGNTQAEADAKARAVALIYLDCFIPSRKLSLKCTDEIISEPAHSQAQTSSDDEVLSEIVTGYKMLAHLLPTLKPDNVTIIEEVTGPVIDERVAVRLHLPEGAFVAESRQAADTSAESFALSNAATKLDCNWSNRRVTYACDDNPAYADSYYHLDDSLFEEYGANGKNYVGPYEIEFKQGQMLNVYQRGLVELMATVSKSDPYVVHVERGEFDSPTSQAAADRVAAAHAMSKLNCVYCNPRIEANCPPANYQPGETNLPLSPDGGSYSFDTTRGIPGIPYFFDESVDPPRWRIISDPCEHSPQGEVPQSELETEAWICSEDPGDVVRVAGDDGSTTLRSIDSSLDCRYCNDFITAACCASPGGEPVMYTKFTPAECEDLASAFDNFTVGECGGNQISDPFAKVAIPACSMFAGSKQAANELALNIAWAQLNCMFANDPCTAECESECENLINTPFSIEVGNHTYDGLHVGPVFVGVETATIEAGIYRSACSQEQADMQACAAAEAQLVCLWTNNPQTAVCPDPGPGDIYHEAAVTSATIPEGTIVTDKCTPYANIIALQLAVMQLFCAYTNEEQCGGCVPYGGPRTYYAADNAGTLHPGSCIDEARSEDSPPAEGEPGVPCIEQNTIITLISTEYANARARDLLPTPPCIYENNPVTVECAPRGIPAGQPNQIHSVTINQGEVVMAQLCLASETAFRLAVAQLVCLWTNEEQEKCCVIQGCPREFAAVDNAGDKHNDSCVSEFPAGAGPRGTDPITGEPIDPVGQGGCIGTPSVGDPPPPGTPPPPPEDNESDCVTVPINTIITPAGTAVANQIAMAMLPNIPCMWESNPVYVECVNRGIPAEGAVLDVTVPQGSIVSNSLCEATETAFRMAVAQLICLWTNEEQSTDCITIGKPRKYWASDNAGDTHVGICMNEALSPDSPGIEVIPEDTIITPLGTPIANEMAKNMLPRVPCLWCSNPAAVNCVPKGRAHPSAVLSATADFCEVQSVMLCEASETAFRSAVAELVCLWTNEEQKDDECPEGFTLEAAGIVPADTIIAPTTAIADKIAKSIAKASKICKQTLYGNTDAYGTDCGDDGEAPDNNRWELETQGYVEANTIWTTDQQASNDMAEAIAMARTKCKPVRRCNLTQTGDSSVCGSRDVCDIGHVGSDTVCGYGFTQTEIDGLAKALADALVVCCLPDHKNEEKEGYIACTTNDGVPCVKGVVAAELITSYSSVEDANAIAQGIADAMTMCCPEVFYNSAQTGNVSCSEGETAYNHTVGAGQIPSWLSTGDADAIALGIANALSFCIPDTGTGGDCEYCIPTPIPSSGTYVLGAVDGALSWIPTEECEETTTPP